MIFSMVDAGMIAYFLLSTLLYIASLFYALMSGISLGLFKINKYCIALLALDLVVGVTHITVGA